MARNTRRALGVFPGAPGFIGWGAGFALLMGECGGWVGGWCFAAARSESGFRVSEPPLPAPDPPQLPTAPSETQRQEGALGGEEPSTPSHAPHRKSPDTTNPLPEQGANSPRGNAAAPAPASHLLGLSRTRGEATPGDLAANPPPPRPLLLCFCNTSPRFIAPVPPFFIFLLETSATKLILVL